MKSMMKKYISLLLAALMIFSSVLPTLATNGEADEAPAEETAVSEEASEEVSAETVEVDTSLMESMAPDNTTIPEAFEYIKNSRIKAVDGERQVTFIVITETGQKYKVTAEVIRSAADNHEKVSYVDIKKE